MEIKLRQGKICTTTMVCYTLMVKTDLTSALPQRASRGNQGGQHADKARPPIKPEDNKKT